DECASNPCLNNGTCTDLENGFLCRCPPEWNGTVCAEPKNPCQSSPCGALGKCIVTNQPQIPYYCHCPDGQNTMFKCADPNPCSPNPCGSGECEITANLLNGYICRCLDGTVQMTNCSEPKDPCVTMPCGPQGRCVALDAAPKGYMCMCQVDGVSYTTIDTCPTTSSFCTHMTCKNGGICVPFSPDEPSCTVGQLGSTCCQCPPNYTGLRCEQEIDFCSSNPCKNNGRCLSGKTGYRCHCYDGYMGDRCDVKTIGSGCSSNPCTIGICYQLKDGGSYVCICPDGTLNLSCSSTNVTQNLFTLPPLPPQPSTPEPLTLLGNNAKFRGGASVNIGSPVSTCNPSAKDVCNGGQCVLIETGVYTCRCREDINECASNPCLGGGTCYDLINAYSCFCPDRVFRSQCNSSIETNYKSGSVSFNNLSGSQGEKSFQTECRCRNGGKCYSNSNNEKICQCVHGFTGSFCEIPISTRINSRQARCGLSSCQNGATCQEQGINTVCVCKPGYTGERCETEYFRCQGNGRFTDVANCKQGRYFECVYFGQYDLNLPNGILYSRTCPPGLWFNTLNDRCDYPSGVKC
ncbi:unnamed protein product, partial [Adineta ricciae]